VLAGKVALVTGGGTGIGKAIGLTLADHGARVAIASRNPAHLHEAAEEFKKSGRACLAVPMDVRNKSDVQNGVATVAKSWGPIDILVNNAGRSGLTAIDDEDDGRWRDILETNLTGAYLVTREVLKTMKDGGRIVSLSSVLGKFGVPGYTAYCASKHGIIGFTKALALEVAERAITVNAICPGWVETEMSRLGMTETSARLGISYEAFERQALAAVPLQRYVQLDEVGHLVLYLASDLAGAITGQAINVCGGQTMV
jgi:NAD(P)-dependent dehydrogenase (short-subunit alcohol dehydrogenase family)